MSATADEVVRGFFGYGPCSRADAEAWACRDAPLDEARRRGPCMILNAWIWLGPAARPAMVAEARHLTADKETLSFKRFHGALALAGMP